MTSPQTHSPFASKTKWNREETYKLISSYQAHPQLWDTACDDYKYPTKKTEAFIEMAQEFQCPREEIEKKITSIRAQFYRELRLVEAKKEANSEDHYSPNWYAFKKLQFLAGKSIARGNRQPKDPAKALHFTKKKKNLKPKNNRNIQGSISLLGTPIVRLAETYDLNPRKNHDDTLEGLPSTSTPKITSLLTNSTGEIEGKDIQEHQDGSDETMTHNIEKEKVNSPLTCRPHTTCTLQIGGHLKANSVQTREEHSTLHGAPDSTYPIQHHCDEFSIFGEYVATTLRKLSGQYLKCYAKHEINDILFHVEAQNCHPNAGNNVNVERGAITLSNIPQQALHYYDLTAPKVTPSNDDH